MKEFRVGDTASVMYYKQRGVWGDIETQLVVGKITEVNAEYNMAIIEHIIGGEQRLLAVPFDKLQ